MLSPFSLAGKTIVVTGASSGIGRQVAILSSEMGAQIVLIGRDEKRLSETLEHMSNGATHTIISVDLTQTQRVEQIIRERKTEIGGINGIVHAAGISTTLPLRVMSDAQLQHFFATNVNGAINLTRLLVKPAFMPQGGSVVFISSVMGVVGEAGKTLYSLTKGALIAGARSLAIEFAGKKIRVNSVSPGVVETPMSGQAVYSRDEVALERVRSYHPLGLGTPDDVAYACIFLLSDAAQWITGSNLIVDGGYSAH